LGRLTDRAVSRFQYLSETAAWDFVKENKGKINFDIVTLCPPWVFGVSDVDISPISICMEFDPLFVDPSRRSRQVRM
jgi:hypothetical protein